ncbi:hypothetical protein B7494_g5631 [Chlorociboria aeruginascens]|nr:hypothetical protein B7494_g5631 [Chlorociboria aeruginascens]
MAAIQTSPPPEVVAREPVAGAEILSHHYSEGEYKEDVSRKPLTIPIPSTGRIQATQLSPVQVNVHPENWPPQASSARIEAIVPHSRETSVDSGSFENEQYVLSDPKGPATDDVPYRPSYNTRSVEQLQQPQAAVLASADSSSSSGIEGDSAEQPVPQLQYHHQRKRGSSPGPLSQSLNDQTNNAASINRHLTPSLQYNRRTPIPRPASAYSEVGARTRSPGLPMSGSPGWGTRAPSAHSGLSQNSRPGSYIDLTDVSYPQPLPAVFSLDNSRLRSVVGTNASLLSTQKTLEMYRQNAKKTQDAEVLYGFADLLIQAAHKARIDQEAASTRTSPNPERDLESPYIENSGTSAQDYLREARHILQKLSDRGIQYAQYILADGYASGLFNKGKEDYGTAFPIFVSASKHGHAESGYRAAICYEYGWGCRKDAAKAVQFYRQAASKNHPGAATRLGRACLVGDLGLSKYREGLTWLKRATESADRQYNMAPFFLGELYENGYGDDVFKDETYAAQLFTQSADLGYSEAAYRMGDAYEYGKLTCPRDPALSVHFYTEAAQRNHPAAMMALCAWYMVGAEPILEKDENEAYEWARKAAESGLTKAEYAVGYFTEMGIGCRRDPLEANVWYVKAADAGDERAKHRLAAIRAAASGGRPMEVAVPRTGTETKSPRDCVIM